MEQNYLNSAWLTESIVNGFQASLLSAPHNKNIDQLDNQTNLGFSDRGVFSAVECGSINRFGMEITIIAECCWYCIQILFIFYLTINAAFFFVCIERLTENVGSEQTLVWPRYCHLAVVPVGDNNFQFCRSQ